MSVFLCSSFLCLCVRVCGFTYIMCVCEGKGREGGLSLK